MPRFYVAESFFVDQSLSLPDAVARHVQVLRMQPGEEITLFDGQGQVYQARISAMGKKNVDVCILSTQAESVESPLAVTLLQSLCSSERMDWVVQKSVELGVARIVPLISERSSQRLSGERAAKKVARWQEIAIAACEQCGRTVVPTVAEVMSMDAALMALPDEGMRLLMSLNRPQSLNQLAKPAAVTLLVGPEGGFGADEEAWAMSAFGFQAISLGPRVLRTETASLAAMAAMQVLWGDFATMG